MQKIKKLADFVLKNGVLAWMAMALVWYLVLSTLRQGISCDEGYYLMGYLRGQNIEGQGTDFHAIVRALCRPFADDDIMVFRYMRLALNLLALVLFAMTSYEWLSKKKGLTLSRWLFYPMMALAGAMSFTFAAPTISYDSIEHILAMFAMSLLFVMLLSDKVWLRCMMAFGIGFLMWFAVVNYPPAGVCLAILFAIVYFMESDAKRWTEMLSVLFGVAMAVLVFHVFVHDLRLWFPEIVKIFESTFTETSKSRHDSGSLVSVMLMTVLKEMMVLVPVVALSALFFWKVRMSKWLQWGLAIALCVFLLLYRKTYELRGTLLLFPVALMLGKVLANSNGKLKEYLLSKDFWIAFVLVAIPLAGVFGTNQAIMNKAVIFAPFWLTAYFLIASRIEKSQCNAMNLVLTALLFAGYVYLGNFQRYHYYYTPRSSKYELVGASRPQNVLVSHYQQQYFADVCDSLRAGGCKLGDKLMAFGENQISVYFAGGFIDGRLPYHWWQYKVFEAEAPQAFILFKSEENDVIGHFSQADWSFPEAYRRMEMRQMSENMGDELRTVIYVRKENNEQ